MAWAAICKEQTFLHPLVAGYACVACGKVCGYVRDKEVCLRDARTDISFAVSAQVNQRGGKAHSEATTVYCILCTHALSYGGHRREGLEVQESALKYENILLSFPILNDDVLFTAPHDNFHTIIVIYFNELNSWSGNFFLHFHRSVTV